MRLRAVISDHLPDLKCLQIINQGSPEQEADHERRQGCHDRPERDVFENIEQDQT
jgi:hypothetical protein